MRLRTIAGIVAAILGAGGAADGSGRVGTGEQINSAPPGLVKLASSAHERLMVGDLAGYRRLVTITEDFTFLGPFGGGPSRSKAFTDSRWAEIVSNFRNGRDAEFELLQAYHSDDLAVLVARERGTAEVAGLPAQDWSLRVTLVFRRVRGEWHLAHRHADPLVRPLPLQEAARLAENPQ